MKRLINPVLHKEFKLRFRSGKSFLGLLFYLLAIGLMIFGFIFVFTLSPRFGYLRPDESRIMFLVLSTLQLTLLLFITPGLTAGVISSEREKQTLNILLTTTQSSLSIIIGKLFSSVSYMIVLLISSLPLYSFVFLYGGVSPYQLIQTFVIYLVTIFSIGSLSVLFSTILRKTIVAMVTSYSVMLFLTLGTAILMAISTFISVSLGASSLPIPYAFSVINPFVVLLSILEPGITDEINSMLFRINLPLWLPYMIFYITIFIFSILFSVRKLRPKLN